MRRSPSTCWIQTSTAVASWACRRAFVSAARTMRCKDTATSPGNVSSTSSKCSRTGKPSAVLRLRELADIGQRRHRRRRLVALRRRLPTRLRIAPIASLPARFRCRRGRSATASGGWSATSRPRWACTTIPVDAGARPVVQLPSDRHPLVLPARGSPRPRGPPRHCAPCRADSDRHREPTSAAR